MQNEVKKQKPWWPDLTLNGIRTPFINKNWLIGVFIKDNIRKKSVNFDYSLEHITSCLQLSGNEYTITGKQLNEKEYN